LTGTEAHHARGVLRLQSGDRVVLFDGRGREATAEITALDSAAVQLHILQEAVTPPLQARITLAQAIPKGKNMDLIVQKSVEIGAAEIFPSFPPAPWCTSTPRVRHRSRQDGRPSPSRQPSNVDRTGYRTSISRVRLTISSARSNLLTRPSVQRLTRHPQTGTTARQPHSTAHCARHEHRYTSTCGSSARSSRARGI
jgi:hypothetical protein